jgi:hypothetical protein
LNPKAATVRPFLLGERENMNTRRFKNPPIDLVSLRQSLTYDPDTGYFYWQVKRKGRGRRDQPAGTITAYGYRHITFCGTAYYAHRLVWLYLHGEWPKRGIDHINGILDDNRISNLRPATDAQNMHNLRRLRKDKKSKYKGVSPDPYQTNRWLAHIRFNSRSNQLGSFVTEEEAAITYDAAALRIFGEYAATNKTLGLLSY